MITLSKPISSGQARAYHREEFANAKENYYTEGERVRGEWQGQLAARWGLQGEVQEQQFARLAEGQHPETGEQLVRHQTAREYVNANGDTVRTMEHRAGWDATFSAPKSVSLTALVGGDYRVREAHRESVRTALDEMEKYAQARMGGNVPAQTTGQWAVAKFEHDSSRPVDGYAAPQLHTHAVIFNITETSESQTRALQPQELYRTQQYATAVYRSELAARLQELGYEIERGAHGQPEIKGYTREYLDASSPRRQQIEEHMEKAGVRGAGAAQIAAHHTRDAKQPLSHEEVRAQHQRLAAEHGQQPQRILRDAAHREGDRVQLTAPYHEQKLANRELGTIERIDGDGNLKLRTDSGREVEFNASQHPHLDYGYAVTSHSSQGQTADRVLIHVDTEQAPGELVNSRMAYVSVSRAQFDVQMYTNDAKALGYELSRDVSHPTAIQQEQIAALKIEPQAESIQVAQGLSMGGD